MYIDKRTLNPFFKKTNSTPQDLLDWVEFLMKECSDILYPCTYFKKGKYLGKYFIYFFSGDKKMWNEVYGNNDVELNISLDYEDINCFDLWHIYVKGRKQPLLDAIKEFKQKYNL